MNLQNLSSKYYAAMGATAAAISMLPGAAFAQALSDGLETEAAGAKGELWTIGGIIVGVCFIGFLIGRGKRVSS